uniref:Pentatricopeptide repeat-containing protein n=1 Tax=Oryza sativa subsp. japonica TaxID=39947 RepID=Q67U31_ORYSJ|nr:hypothetical protein [Oryza sativa Japonica Group]BAD38340.1 hypothetical protein [Oryza sativa Japonica Group]
MVLHSSGEGQHDAVCYLLDEMPLPAGPLELFSEAAASPIALRGSASRICASPLVEETQHGRSQHMYNEFAGVDVHRIGSPEGRNRMLAVCKKRGQTLSRCMMKWSVCWLHMQFFAEFAVTTRLNPILIIYNSLMDMYAKSNESWEAENILKQLESSQMALAPCAVTLCMTHHTLVGGYASLECSMRPERQVVSYMIQLQGNDLNSDQKLQCILEARI